MDPRIENLYHWLGRTVHVEMDRPMGYLHGDTRYPINYGYIPGTLAADGEEQDAYILGVDHPVASFDGQVVAAICRLDDVEDKLVVAPAGMEFHQGQIKEAVHFQEQYFHSHVISLLAKSCGVLPWRDGPEGKEYLLVFEEFSQCWSLPKGHMEPGETEEMTAARELLEETGLTAQLDTGHRAVMEYPLRPAGRKQVVFFPGQVSGEPVARPGEIRRCKWVRAEELAAHLFSDTANACQALIDAMDK